MTLREECDSLFSNGGGLRDLAKKIASLDWQTAKMNGLLSADPPPFNLLANGETGSAWSPPDQIMPTDLIVWKKSANGFAASTARGLSLIFDPFVDACLIIWGRGRFQGKPKVLVLTDYYPLSQIGLKPGQDWAAQETGKFFKALELGLSGNNLFKALADESSIENVRNTSDEEIRTLFGEPKLLIWNYFPFLRGGKDSQGVKGLPSPVSNCNWINCCEGFLRCFIDCVQPSHVLFAMNKAVRNARAGCIKGNLAACYKSAELDHPGSCRSVAKLKTWGSQLREVLEYNLCRT